MSIKVAKWGNSIGVRVPAAIAATAGLKPGTEVELVLEGRAVKLVPVKAKAGRRYRLATLLSGITKANLHGERGAGRAVGAEVIE